MIFIIISITVLSVIMAIICRFKTNACWEMSDNFSEKEKEQNAKKTFAKYASITSLIAIVNIVVVNMALNSLLVIPGLFLYIYILALILVYTDEYTYTNIVSIIAILSIIAALISLVVTLYLSGYEMAAAVVGCILLFGSFFIGLIG